MLTFGEPAMLYALDAGTMKPLITTLRSS
jgi:hypothetical protein